jgi:positive regulator of sigma E activity
MKKSLIDGMNSFFKLLRFLAWYGIGVVTIFYLLPIIGLMIEVQYEQMSGAARFSAVLGLFLVVGAWQLLSMRDRRRESLQTA